MFKHNLLILYILLLLPIKGWSVDFTSDTFILTPQNITTQSAVPQNTKILTKKSTNKLSSSIQTASDVFIDFAKKVLGTSYETQLGSKWEKSITQDTKYWTAEDSHQFLSFLESRIGSLATAKLIKTTYYFQHIRTKSFKERVNLYSQYIGEEAVNSRLKQSLHGFHVGKIKLIRSNIEFIISYVNNKKESNEIIKKQIYNLSATLSDMHNLPNLVQFLESYIGKKEVIFVLKNTSYILYQTPLSRLKSNISFLENYISKNQISFMIKKSFGGFMRDDFKEIKSTIQILEKYLNKSNIVLGLSNISFPFKRGLQHLTESINFLESYISKEEITKKLQKSFIIFSTKELKHLKQMEKEVGRTQTAIYLETNILNTKPTVSIPSYLSSSSKFFYNTAGDVFIDFAKTNLGDGYEKTVGAKWEEQIIYNTRHWTVQDSQNFLSFLVNRIGLFNTIKRIQFSTYFIKLRFDSFIDRVQLYTKYIGEEAVNAMLKQSVYGFHTGKIDIIQSNIEFIRSYIQLDKTFNSIMQKSVGWLSVMSIKRLSAIIQFLENYLSKNEIIWIMQRNIDGLSHANINKLKPVVHFLENYVSRSHIAWIMKNNFESLTGSFNKTKDNIEFLESYIGKERVIILIKKHFYTLTQIKTHRLKEVTHFMEQEVGKKAVVEAIMKNLYTLSKKSFNQKVLTCKTAFQFS